VRKHSANIQIKGSQYSANIQIKYSANIQQISRQIQGMSSKYSANTGQQHANI